MKPDRKLIDEIIANNDAIEAFCNPGPKSQQWDGKGLPSVGVECEAGIPHVSGANGEVRSILWVEGHPIAHFECGGKTYTWFASEGGFYPPGVYEFRPIKTPEQLAAEQRERAIAATAKELHESRGELSPLEHSTIVATWLYDHGYRKHAE